MRIVAIEICKQGPVSQIVITAGGTWIDVTEDGPIRPFGPTYCRFKKLVARRFLQSIDDQCIERHVTLLQLESQFLLDCYIH
jgi:hypothetical protein